MDQTRSCVPARAAVRTAFADKLRVAEARITIVASTVQGARLRRQLTSGSSVTFMVNIVANSQSEVSSMTAALAASGWGTELQQSIQQQLPGVGAGVTAVRTGDVGAGSCSSNEECNGHGTCRSGDCTCDAGWDTAQTSDAAACPVTNLGCCFERPEAGCNAEDHAVLAQIGAGIAVAFLGLPLHLYLYCRRRCRARAARAADANDTKERVRSPSAASLTGENPGINEETTAEQKPKFEPMEMEAAASDHGEKRVVDEPYEMGLKDKFLVKWFKLNLSTRQLGTITFLQTSYAMYLLLSSMLGERFDFALYTAPDGSEYGTPAAGSPTKNPISEQMQRGTGSLTQPSLMQVTVPPGMQPGMQMQIKSLDGRLMSVVIPAGCGPGSTFQVQATNSLQTQAQVHKTFASGAKYEGEWEGGKMHGRGKLTLKSGSVYTGGFAHGKFHGQGLLRSADGSIYEGEYKDDKKHGKGKQTFKSGSVYTGGFAHGKFHGQGLLHSADGSTYEGEYKDDKKHGKGKQTLKSGSVYTGGFAHGKFHGQGLMRSADGSTYEGEYKYGKKHGQGKLTRKPKEGAGSMAVQEGEFVDDKFVGKAHQ
eukprot:g5553.t1